MTTLAIRALDGSDELMATETLQRDVWGLGDLDVVPAAQLKAAVHSGGHVLGAYRGTELVGFAYAFVALPHGRGMSGVGLHSHMVGVQESARGSGVGQSLKWSQRRLALKQGLNWITWTFDPLQARNANLNLNRLGAICRDYLVDFYGAMAGPLGGGQASDRLLALWLLDAPRVRALAPAEPAATESSPEANADAARSSRDAATGTSGDKKAEAPASDTWLLTAAMVDEYGPAGHAALSQAVAVRSARLASAVVPVQTLALGSARAGRTLVATPENVTALLADAPDQAALWRTAVRTALVAALDAGWMATGFEDGAYLLTRSGKEKEKAYIL